MQVKIRSTSTQDFAIVDKFVDFKEAGQLRSPQEVAKVIEQLLMDDRVKNGAVLDISTYSNNKLF